MELDVQRCAVWPADWSLARPYRDRLEVGVARDALEGWRFKFNRHCTCMIGDLARDMSHLSCLLTIHGGRTGE
jgi:hypothetical protein